MNIFYEPLKELNEFAEAEEQLQKGQTPIQVTGCIDSQKSHFIAGLAQKYPYCVIITHDELKAKELYEDYKLYDKNVFLYPAKDVIFYSADIHGNAIVRERMKVLRQLLEGKPATIITTMAGGMDRLLPLDFIKENVIHLAQADIIDIEKLKKELVYIGYERCVQVEHPGEFAVRGGIIDLFPLTEECPYRIELWDDEIDTIRAFDAESQRSIENVSELSIFPATEIIMDEDTLSEGLRRMEKEKDAYIAKLRKDKKLEEVRRIKDIIGELKDNIESYGVAAGLESYIRYFYKEGTVSLFEYFKDGECLFVLDEPARVEEQTAAIEYEFSESMKGRVEKGYILPGQMDALIPQQEIAAILSKKPLVLMSTMMYGTKNYTPKMSYNVTVRSVNPYNNNFEILVKDLEKWKEKGYRVLLLSGSRTRAIRLSENLREYDLNSVFSKDMERTLLPKEIVTAHGNLHKGFEYPFIKFVVISESDIFGGEKKKRKQKKKPVDGSRIQSFSDLAVGDYVVHENHGLGIYRGIEKIEVDQVVKDYIKIEYAGGGVLYVLATGLEGIQKYASQEAKRPKLNKLNSIEWTNTKKRVRGAVEEIAKDLVELYAKRQMKEGFAYSEDTVWQQEFEEMFPYEETDDQLNAIADTKADMESHKIMDRLICGDVGYGKTEIAIRAAFKAVSDGKQVAFLVPTTILAQQHYNNFVQRMKDFPISIEMMSRFRTTAEQKKTIERLKSGQVDIVIGTHRVLSKDIAFKNLGLLIVDEEQRFGVTHKEKLKKLKEDVDVLTLSATPIPRTLHMSLVGIRDMSVLEEPPVDRMPIQTFVLEHNDEIIREAINRELARDGQVYYVYNKVKDIDEVAAKIAELVPSAEVAFAHGQMSERELEKIMYRFINGEIDVLVSTTIIETGLDISNVNTMIIEDADHLGLSQLYQLRGRVGRSNRTAYAFLMYRRGKMLKEVAEKRLQAIKEFTELGSGFKIAMRDLEIRGAGNLLGAKQHGHMESVGYDLYCKMLNDAVKKLKGEAVNEDDYETTVEVDLNAYIPPTYIKSEYQKLEMYKRIADITTEEELLEMQDELIDRFGDLPENVNNLLFIAYIRTLAHKAQIVRVLHKGYEVKCFLYPQARIDINKIPPMMENYGKALSFNHGGNPYFVLNLAYRNQKYRLTAKDLFDRTKKLVEDIKELEIREVDTDA